MTIIINVTVPEGIVFSADSRQTYTNRKGDLRVSSDHARKLFPLNQRIAAVTSGWAFLDGRNINSHVHDFKLSLSNPDLPVAEMARCLGEYLTGKYQVSVEKKYDDPVEETSYAVALLVGGYDPGGKQGQVYEVFIPKGESFLVRTSDEKPGSVWRGYTPVISRLLRGHDPRIREMEGFSEELGKALDDGGLGYLVDYWCMTLQDAVDFSMFLAQTTIQMQRFSDGIGMAPGGSADCGGEIDVAVIDPEEGFKWVQNKHLRGGPARGDLLNGET